MGLAPCRCQCHEEQTGQHNKLHISYPQQIHIMVQITAHFTEQKVDSCLRLTTAFILVSPIHLTALPDLHGYKSRFSVSSHACTTHSSDSPFPPCFRCFSGCPCTSTTPHCANGKRFGRNSLHMRLVPRKSYWKTWRQPNIVLRRW